MSQIVQINFEINDEKYRGVFENLSIGERSPTISKQYKSIFDDFVADWKTRFAFHQIPIHTIFVRSITQTL